MSGHPEVTQSSSSPSQERMRRLERNAEVRKTISTSTYTYSSFFISMLCLLLCLECYPLPTLHRSSQPGGFGWFRASLSVRLCWGETERDQEHQQVPQQPGDSDPGTSQQGGPHTLQKLKAHISPSELTRWEQQDVS